MSWTLFFQIMGLMFWAAILLSPWTPRARARTRAMNWTEVDRNDPRITGK